MRRHRVYATQRVRLVCETGGSIFQIPAKFLESLLSLVVDSNRRVKGSSSFCVVEARRRVRARVRVRRRACCPGPGDACGLSGIPLRLPVEDFSGDAETTLLE